MYVRSSLYKRREENQLDATDCLIALVICSTCFGHLYAYHQELETILVLLPHQISRPQFHLLLLGSLRVIGDVQAPGGESGNV